MTQASISAEYYARTTLVLNLVLAAALIWYWREYGAISAISGFVAAIFCITVFLITPAFVNSLANLVNTPGPAAIFSVNLARVILAFFVFNEWPGSEDGAGITFAFVALPAIWILALLSTRPLASTPLFISMLSSTLFMFAGVFVLYLTQERLENVLFLPTSLFHLIVQGRFFWVVNDHWSEQISHIVAWAWWAAVIYLFLRWRERLNTRL